MSRFEVPLSRGTWREVCSGEMERVRECVDGVCVSSGGNVCVGARA